MPTSTVINNIKMSSNQNAHKILTEVHTKLNNFPFGRNVIRATVYSQITTQNSIGNNIYSDLAEKRCFQDASHHGPIFGPSGLAGGSADLGLEGSWVVRLVALGVGLCGCSGPRG